jgi:D-alanyl-lipoteichoic acid acyltransferase DltB (MBOAT superfamily)
MLFNSIDFAIFLPLVFAIYWAFAKTSKAQNVVLLFASLIFYGWWDYRFLSLILFSTVVDFLIGKELGKNHSSSKRKLLLRLSLVVNIGLLGFFKYFNFFQESFVTAFNFFGGSIEGYSLSIVLPVGISFYTFQTLSYTIDIYRKEIKPVPRFIDFVTFVTFFPQLVAGPIERASKMLPQLDKKRTFRFEQGKAGVQLIIFGLFRKIVIADNLGMYVDRVWEYPQAITPYMAVFASVFFSVQIYMDFSGYSRIARGVAKLFGIELMVNFNYPYKARSFGEFWSRWHISLSTWFRDYLYIPLGGNRKGNLKTVVNLAIVFTISGLWHGAAWTFVLWGVLHFSMLSLERVVKIQRTKITDYLLWIKTLVFVNLSWILFRAPSFGDASSFLTQMLTPEAFVGINSLTFQSPIAFVINMGLILGLPIFLSIERKFNSIPHSLQNSIVVTALVLMTVLQFSKEKAFIYFQF